MAALVTGRTGELTGKYVSMGKITASSVLSYGRANAPELWKASAAMVGLPVDLGDAGPDRAVDSVFAVPSEARPAKGA
jgi:hypothetical protein